MTRPFNSSVNPGTTLLLYVDDDVTNQTVLDMMLSGSPKYRVLLACDQAEIQETLMKENVLPDIVIMDSKLTNCTGAEVIEWMREHYSPRLLFVICTARPPTEAARLTACANAHSYICKPYTSKELFAAIEQCSTAPRNGTAYVKANPTGGAALEPPAARASPTPTPLELFHEVPHHPAPNPAASRTTATAHSKEPMLPMLQAQEARDSTPAAGTPIQHNCGPSLASLPKTATPPTFTEAPAGPPNSQETQATAAASGNSANSANTGSGRTVIGSIFDSLGFGRLIRESQQSTRASEVAGMSSPDAQKSAAEEGQSMGTQTCSSGTVLPRTRQPGSAGSVGLRAVRGPLPDGVSTQKSSISTQRSSLQPYRRQPYGQRAVQSMSGNVINDGAQMPLLASSGLRLTASQPEAGNRWSRVHDGALPKDERKMRAEVQSTLRILNTPAAVTNGTPDRDIDMTVPELLEVLGLRDTASMLLPQRLSLQQLRKMSAMEIMERGVVLLPELEALMDALHAL